uniref:Transmembrane protein n=1 Tax=Oryza brachyantha TaxID=4533 RepID=J3N6M9_ORYBR
MHTTRRGPSCQEEEEAISARADRTDQFAPSLPGASDEGQDKNGSFAVFALCLCVPPASSGAGATPVPWRLRATRRLPARGINKPFLHGWRRFLASWFLAAVVAAVVAAAAVVDWW